MKQRLLILACSVALLAACGTTRIYTNDPNARIYVDGEMVGKGSASVRKRGGPGSSQIIIKTADGRRFTKQMRRKFTYKTLLIGLVTSYIGFVAAWEYPDSVYVAVTEDVGRPSRSWDGAGDAWLQAPPGWEPKNPTPPTPVDETPKGVASPGN